MVFARYVRDMTARVASCRPKIGCNVDGISANILAYADYIVLFAYSSRGLQQLLDMVVQQSGLAYHCASSVCVFIVVHFSIIVLFFVVL